MALLFSWHLQLHVFHYLIFNMCSRYSAPFWSLLDGMWMTILNFSFCDKTSDTPELTRCYRGRNSANKTNLLILKLPQYIRTNLIKFMFYSYYRLLAYKWLFGFNLFFLAVICDKNSKITHGLQKTDLRANAYK